MNQNQEPIKKNRIEIREGFFHLFKHEASPANVHFITNGLLEKQWRGHISNDNNQYLIKNDGQLVRYANHHKICTESTEFTGTIDLFMTDDVGVWWEYIGQFVKGQATSVIRIPESFNVFDQFGDGDSFMSDFTIGKFSRQLSDKNLFPFPQELIIDHAAINIGEHERIFRAILCVISEIYEGDKFKIINTDEDTMTLLFANGRYLKVNQKNYSLHQNTVTYRLLKFKSII